MKRIVNVLWYKTNNVGDTVTSPLDYFSFPLPVEKRDIKEDLSGLEDAFIILGGGGLIHLPAPDYNHGIFGHFEPLRKLGKYRVLWGVGHNIYYNDYRYLTVMANMPNLSDFHLVRLRDESYKLMPRYYHVPCPSCCMDIFGFPKKTGGGIKAVLHEGTEPTIDVDTILCEGSTFDEVIQFIRNADAVLTNSYHVMYWAELMDKPVILKQTNSTKFLLHKKVSVREAHWKNLHFYREVLNLIEKYEREPE